MPTANIGGTDISYQDHGNGDVIVFLHASASSGEQWRTLRGHIGNEYRIITPDFYGCGRSAPWHGRESMTLAAEAAIIDGLAATIGRPFHLVGHSYGGAVALRMAAQSAQRIKSLTLIEPVSFHLLRMGAAADRKAFDEIADLVDALCRSVIAGDEWNGMGRFVDYWNGHGTWSSLPWEKRRQLAPRIRTTLYHFWSTIREAMPLDSYRQVRMPVSVIWGGRTRTPTRRIAELLSGSLPQAQATVFDDATHMLPLTHAERLADNIVPFVDGKARWACQAA